MPSEKERVLENLVRAHYRHPNPANIPGTPCPDENTVAAYLETRLAKQEVESFQAHLASCSRCREAVAVILRAMASEAEAAPPEKKVGTRPWWRWLPAPAITRTTQALAAGVVVFAVAVAVYRYVGPGGVVEAPATRPEAPVTVEMAAGMDKRKAEGSPPAPAAAEAKPSTEQSRTEPGKLAAQQVPQVASGTPAKVSEEMARDTVAATPAPMSSVTPRAAAEAAGRADARRQAEAEIDALKSQAFVDPIPALEDKLIQLGLLAKADQAGTKAAPGESRKRAATQPEASLVSRSYEGKIFYRIHEFWVDAQTLHIQETVVHPIEVVDEALPPDAPQALQRFVRLGDRVLALHEGRIYYLVTPKKILQEN